MLSTKAMIEAEAMTTFLNKITQLLQFAALFSGIAIIVAGFGSYMVYSRVNELGNILIPLANQTATTNAATVKMLTEIAAKVGVGVV